MLPDFGVALAKGGMKEDESFMIDEVTIKKMNAMHYPKGIIYTTDTVIDIKGTAYMASIDLLGDHITYIINALVMLGEEDAALNLGDILLKDMMEVHFSDTPIVLLLTIGLGNVEESAINERFIPLRVLEVNGVAVGK